MHSHPKDGVKSRVKIRVCMRVLKSRVELEKLLKLLCEHVNLECVKNIKDSRGFFSIASTILAQKDYKSFVWRS